MHIFVVVCGILSVLTGGCVGIPYIRSILRGATKPHQFTWLIFSIVNGIVALSQFLTGGRLSVLVYLLYFIYAVLYFIFSLKYGVRNSSRYDRLLLSVALITIVLWVLTRDNTLAIWLTILIDTFATTMLVLKIRAHPGTEPFRLWLLGTSAVVFSCLTLINGPFGILYLRPVYSVLSDVVILIAIAYYQPKIKSRTKKSEHDEVVML